MSGLSDEERNRHAARYWLRRLDELVAWEQEYGATEQDGGPLPPETLARARALIAQQAWGLFHIAPSGPDLALEWHFPGTALEVYLGPEGKVEYLVGASVLHHEGWVAPEEVGQLVARTRRARPRQANAWEGRLKLALGGVLGTQRFYGFADADGRSVEYRDLFRRLTEGVSGWLATDESPAYSSSELPRVRITLEVLDED